MGKVEFGIRKKKLYSRRKNEIKSTFANLLFEFFIKFVMVLAVGVTLYPILYVVSMSISDPKAVMSMEVKFLPVGFSLESFRLIFKNPQVITGYYNTLWYTVVGTFVSILVTILGAYPLSRKNFFGRRFFMKAIIFTMYFSGGMVPLFILIINLGLFNTRWAILLPSLLSASNLIITRTFFEGISDSLIESAKIDGANDFLILYKIVLPIAKPVIAVMVLYYAVGRWNSYFDALLYLRDTSLQPIQVYLMRVLTQSTVDSSLTGLTDMATRSSLGYQLRYSMIVMTTLPIILVYPFVQKYFIKGVMMEALKE